MISNPSSTRPEIADWLLERYALQELPATAMERVREALARDEGLRQRLAALEADSAAALAAHPPARVSAAIRARVADETARRRALWRRPALAFAAPMLLAVAVVGVWLGQGPVRPAPSMVEPDTTRIKGTGPQLMLFRRTGAVVEKLSTGATASSGDVVQLAYLAAGGHFGAIISVDGRGVVTSHLPATGAVSAALQSGGPVTLETAYRLDDAPRFEAFYLVTARQPFELAPVRAAAAAAASTPRALPTSLPLPASLDQTAVLLRKDILR
jgi:hypothetical protein